MRINNISTHVMYNYNRQTLMQQKKDFLEANYELVNGRVPDIGLALGGKIGRFLNIENQQSLLNELKITNGLIAERMAAGQIAIKSLVYAPRSNESEPEGALVRFNKILLGASSGKATSRSLTKEAQLALDVFVSALNTNIDGEFVFGGANTNEPPLTYYKAGSDEGASKIVRDEFRGYFGFSPDDSAAASITKEQMQEFIDGPFSDLFEDPSWGINFSKADDIPQRNSISPDGVVVDTSVSANKDAFRQAMKSLILVAEFSEAGLSEDAVAAVEEGARNSSSASIGSAINKISIVSSHLGSLENRIQSATEQIESQLTLLQDLRMRFIGIDQNEAAARLEEIKLMIAVSNGLTVQISRLSLVNYLSVR
ncbi:MAG: flagellar hook-associated protein 3 FlgL [Candidatus Tokpelaia sp. JSC189]|nr:MAG: flagellar hook-associated protein 3 FlgL [Candidatus Tokpelaia sp. JSC189]